ncbi:MAG: response regulator transcription factor [Clostridia bacterium]|nr:response regulator transcription factor [Clostridia bacterium]
MSDQKTVLIVDDDKDINSLLREILQSSYGVLQAFNGVDALRLWQQRDQKPVDLFLLDLMLPDINGEELLKKIRQNSNVPIIVLTAKGDTHTLVDVLDLGADDYVSKPFKSEELLARVRAHLRRPIANHNTQGEVLCSGDLKVDTGSYEAYFGESKIHLPSKEFELLHYLMSEAGRVVTKEELYVRVWGNMFLTDDNTINVHISRLRNKLREHLEEDPIETIWGVGFRFRGNRAGDTVVPKA